MLIALILCLTLVHLGCQQTFQYSVDWTNGKRSVENTYKTRLIRPHFYHDQNKKQIIPFREIHSLIEKDETGDIAPTFDFVVKHIDEDKIPLQNDLNYLYGNIIKENIGYICDKGVDQRYSTKNNQLDASL